MDLKFPKKTLTLSLDGMLIIPVFVNNFTGEVRLGFIDATQVDKVITNPMNAEEVQAIRISNTQGKTITVINENPEGLLEGECFYFSINNLSNQPEGVGDLVRTADLIDMLKELCVSVVQFARMQYRNFEDVTITGSETDVRKYLKDNPLDYDLGRRVHTDKVKHQLVTPNVNSTDSSNTVRMIKNFALGSQRFPEHWFGDGGNTNLATAVEQSVPTMRRLKNRQQYVVYILQTILTHCLHQAYIKKLADFDFSRDELDAISIEIIAPEFERKDIDKVATGLGKVADMLSKAEEKKWISKETAGKMFRTMTDIIGYNIEEDEEAALINSQKEEDVEKTTDNKNPVDNSENSD